MRVICWQVNNAPFISQYVGIISMFRLFLVSIVMLYDGLTMIDMIDANHMNTIHFLEVSI